MDAVSLADQKEDCAAYIAFFTTYIAVFYFFSKVIPWCRKKLEGYF